MKGSLSLALVRLAIAHPDRLMVVCSKCHAPKRPERIAIRGEGRFRNVCKECESKRVGGKT